MIAVIVILGAMVGVMGGLLRPLYRERAVHRQAIRNQGEDLYRLTRRVDLHMRQAHPLPEEQD